MKIATIVGARPQFIKAATVSRAISKTCAQNGKSKGSMEEVIIHTGQHYDENMSEIFFKELEIPMPKYHLEVGSGSHGLQTGLMLQRIEEVFVQEKPDVVLVYGDTNSTLAGALAAAKLHITLAHVEAGLRSFNKLMPEEINRVLTDRISDYLFCPTQTAVENLSREGVTEGVYLTGDVMFDMSLYNISIAEKKPVSILDKLNLEPGKYYLTTVHRASNTDNRGNLKSILEALNELEQPVIFPVHPRTRKNIEDFGLSGVSKFYDTIPSSISSGINFLNPVGYLDMLVLEKNARKIITDSGGMQKEAYFFEVPCVTLRDETEWVETIDSGWNILTGTDKEKIIKAVNVPVNSLPMATDYFGNGDASEKICRILQGVHHGRTRNITENE